MTAPQTYKIGWIDSAKQSSRIHKTIDGKETICGGHAYYIENRELAIIPSKDHGRSRFCKICFADGGKNSPWFKKI